jgi:hypothetical protein
LSPNQTPCTDREGNSIYPLVCMHLLNYLSI